MALKLTPLGIVTKWLVLPIAIGCLGFYLIGPRVGEVAAKAATVPGLKSAVDRLKEVARKAKGVETNSAAERPVAPKSNGRGQAFMEMRENSKKLSAPTKDAVVDVP